MVLSCCFIQKACMDSLDYKHAYLNTLLLLHSAFMLSVVKMPLKGEVSGHALDSHRNYIVYHGKIIGWCCWIFVGNLSCFWCHLTFFKIDLFKKFFQEHFQSVKPSRSGPTELLSWSGSKLFAKVSSRWPKLMLARKELYKPVYDKINKIAGHWGYKALFMLNSAEHEFSTKQLENCS